jgi:hypothetical protein
MICYLIITTKLCYEQRIAENRENYTKNPPCEIADSIAVKHDVYVCMQILQFNYFKNMYNF